MTKRPAAGGAAAQQAKAVAYAEAEAAVLGDLSEGEKEQLRGDGEVSRYVRATGGCKVDALRRLRDTFVWRQRERPETLLCSACAQDPKSHYMHVVRRPDHLEASCVHASHRLPSIVRSRIRILQARQGL